MAYLVDTDELFSLLRKEKKRGFLSSVFGKKSEQEKMIEALKPELDDLDESIQEWLDEDDENFDVPIARKVIDEFLTDNISNAYEGHVYGYVFKNICEYKGDFLDNSEWYPCSIDSFYAIPFTEMTLPVKFPHPDDWPALGYISHTKIDLENAEYEGIDEIQKERLIDWFTRAKHTQKDIYLFMH